MKKFLKFDKNLFTVSSSVGSISLFPLLFPMLFECVMNNLQGTVNTVVLSFYSETSVAAVGAANTVINVVILLGTIIAMGATVCISNSIGQENIKRAKEISFSAIVVAACVAVVVSVLMLIFSRKILLLLNLSGGVLSEALVYFRIRMLFLIITMVNSAILALLKCYGYPKYTFYIGLVTNILNLILNMYVIFLPQYSPVTGVRGVAYSCCVSYFIGLLISVFFLKRLKIQIKRPDTTTDLFRHIKSILRIGLPGGLSSMTFNIANMVTVSFVAMLGDAALSAKVYYANILSYVYLFSVSAGNANALLVGRRYGAGDFDRADKMNRQLVKITRVVNLLISLAVILFRRQLVGMFTSSEEIITLSFGIFAVDIITEQARATSQVYEYALRAAGDVIFSVVVVVISCVLLSVVLAYFLTIHCGLGLIGCWIGLTLDETVRAVATYWRWKSGKWKKGVISNG